MTAEVGTLVLVGSAKPAARAVVEALAEQKNALVLTLKREVVLDQDETGLMALRSGAAAALLQGRWVVVRSENWPGAVEATKRLAGKRWIPADEVERRVRGMLARTARGVVEETGAPAVVIGTETGDAVAHEFGGAKSQVVILPGETATVEFSASE